MENNKKNTKKTYNVFAVIKRLMTHMWKQDKAQYGRMAVYTVIGALQPFLAVFLPKLAIGILEQGGEDAIRNLMIAMAGYFVAAGVIVTAVRYLSAYISTRNMRMRLNYLGQLADRLQTMDYCHHENAGFFELYLVQDGRSGWEYWEY